MEMSLGRYFSKQQDNGSNSLLFYFGGQYPDEIVSVRFLNTHLDVLGEHKENFGEFFFLMLKCFYKKTEYSRKTTHGLMKGFSDNNRMTAKS